MTRKDYVAIAKAFDRTRPNRSAFDDDAHGDWSFTDQMEQWTFDRQVLANILQDDNPRFDRERFYRACEGK